MTRKLYLPCPDGVPPVKPGVVRLWLLVCVGVLGAKPNALRGLLALYAFCEPSGRSFVISRRLPFSPIAH